MGEQDVLVAPPIILLVEPPAPPVSTPAYAVKLAESEASAVSGGTSQVTGKQQNKV